MKRILFVILFLACTQPQFAQAQVNGTAINLNDPDQISYLSPKDYIIGGVTVSGTQHLDNNVLITISKLVVGQYIEVPSEATSNVVKVMMAQGLFDDVQLWAEKIEGETIFLNIRVNERPRLTRIDINGLSKSQTEEVRKRLKDNAGKVVNENLINTTRNTIQRFLREKAYLYPEIKISTIKDTTQANNEILIADVDRKNKVRVKKITFTGNKEFTQKQLRKNLKGVKQKAWFRIFGPGKFKEEKYKEAKETLVAKMQNKGFRDAEIIQDSVIKVDDKNVLVNIDVYEGPKYYVGNIKWSGNAKYTDTVLNRILGIRKGDIFSEEKLTTKLMGGGRNSDDISSLYMNDGYLTFSIDPEQTRIYNDTIDLNLRVYEGAQFTINNIIVKGNDVTNDRVVLRSIRTKPGQKFQKKLS